MKYKEAVVEGFANGIAFLICYIPIFLILDTWFIDFRKLIELIIDCCGR